MNAQQLDTLMKRYAKKTKNLTGKAVDAESKRLFDKLSNVIDFREPTEIKMRSYYTEAVEKMNAKGLETKDFADIDHWQDQQAGLIKFMNKHQNKLNQNVDPMSQDKAGQGIAAWSKILNVFMMCWFRHLENLMLNSARDKPNSGFHFHYINKYTDEQIAKILDVCCANPKFQFFESDFKEFDSSQNNCEQKLCVSS